jgi:hypothetical protein
MGQLLLAKRRSVLTLTSSVYAETNGPLSLPLYRDLFRYPSSVRIDVSVIELILISGWRDGCLASKASHMAWTVVLVAAHEALWSSLLEEA